MLSRVSNSLDVDSFDFRMLSLEFIGLFGQVMAMIDL